ncbi:T9SS type A sorting domain-containing protein [Thalassobellus citreus]|uniref:T9SS type A sorting domain-containing protein n=1 Tax=Thalassobellus citreus TaxID=3367752 RepID=UPI0037A8C9B4
MLKNISLISIFISVFYAESQNLSVARFYYQDSIIAMEQFSNNKKLDSIKTYYKTGELDELFYFNKSSLNGESYKFNKTGEKIVTWIFNNDKLISRTDHFIKFNKKNKTRIQLIHDELVELNKLIKNTKNGTVNTNLILQLSHKRLELGNRILALSDLMNVVNSIESLPEEDQKKYKLSSYYDALGNVYESFEMYRLANIYKSKALKEEPNNSYFQYKLGAFKYTSKNYKSALKYLKKVIQKSPEHAAAHNILASLYIDFEAYENAMYHLYIAFRDETNLIKYGLDNTDNNLLTKRGFLQHKLGFSENGILDLKEAIYQDPQNSFAHRTLGFIYSELGKNNEACTELLIAKKLGYEKIHDRNDLSKHTSSWCKNDSISSKTLGLNKRPYVSPNPATDLIKIKNINDSNFEFEIFNSDNIVVKHGISEEKSIRLFGLQPDFYTLKIKSKGLEYTMKFVKKKAI